MRHYRPLGLIVILVAGGLLGWRQHRKQVRQAEEIADVFPRGVAPLLEHSCLKCHGPEAQEGDLRLDSRDALLIGGKSGPVVVPGDPKNSLLLQLVKHHDPAGDRVMPPKGKMKKSAVEDLEKWILAGAVWPDKIPELTVDGKKENPPAPGPHGDAWTDPENPITKLFGGQRLDLWSLKPVADPVPPAVRQSDWTRNPIDQFILAKMETAGRKPAPEADRRTLARRLSLDLTGLLPTQEQVDSFLEDRSPEAYEKLVDALLASPAYGEQAARQWLDVVRYSDSNGFDYDEFRPDAWRFRDYVIRCFNADKPYDRFVREQLAGDELTEGPPRDAAEQDDLIATGFLRVGPYDNSAVLFGESERCRAQVLSDLVETTGTAFMGMNLSCCRCHDHKVDPISQADYYRLKAVFANVRPASSPLLDLPDARKVIQPEIAAIEDVRAGLEKITQSAIIRILAEKTSGLSEADQKLLASDDDILSKEQRLHQLELKRLIHTTPVEAKTGFTPEEKQAYEQVKAKVQGLEGRRSKFTPGLLAEDAGYWVPPTGVFRKGDYASPGEEVTPGILSVLDPNPLPAAKTVRGRSSGRRTALADWLFSSHNPLTARVMVNRLWQSHFGQGIVATPNDFGFAGSRPSHPELLDWLAREFHRNGWSVKQMHRLIVLSATYRQGSLGLETGQDEGALLIGLNPRRQSAEEIRDSLLQVSGLLQSCQGGPPRWPELPEEVLASNPGLLVENEEKNRGWYPSPPDQVDVRSIYLIQKRSLRLPMLETFDKPESHVSCGRRDVSIVAPQALTLLNSPFAASAARAFASRLEKENPSNPEQQTSRAFALAFQRSPDDTERADSGRFIAAHGLTEFCRVLMNTDEFLYVD